MKQKEVILSIVQESPSVELLRLRNRDLVLDFFLLAFNKDITNISYENLQQLLLDYISHHNTSLEENESNTIETLETKVKSTIREWTNKGFLANYKNESGDIFYELSPHTNKTINWLFSLEKKEFVGAESKFKDIFNKLKELVEFTNEDIEKRIEILEDKKLNIEQEIQQLKIGENIKVFEEHEIIPRFQQLTFSAKELLSDFKEVEDNFKNITKDIYQKHTDENITKSDILTFTFDALDDLKESYQGKSFYAFWRFLMDRNLQEEWNILTDELYSTLAEKNIQVNDTFLKSMKNYLHTSGNKVYQANDKMAEKLSRIIRENDNSEKKLAKKVIQEIKNYLTEVSRTKARPDLSIEVEVINKINIPFDKRLTFEPKEEITYNNKPELAKNDISQSNQLSKIFKENVIDKNLLRNRIKEVLKLKSQTTLNEVIEYNGGIEKGLPELFGYFGIVKDFTHSFNPEKQQEIIFDKVSNKSIKVPEIILIK
ncbi:DUF3375 family protein [Arcticibacterium luteifluviistationis]|uniref:DUF3375 domain-containing protein n=1 Tax=Arcticibacterium luteifluviistationis TaxID=1784714 RepID=A0A2Z4G7P5_9BACT|nr:DUF3375 family protein [Arcticibacterium luteifluviistationis]AWV97167.1 DUF3375 domain-containing protein [Arcticibacterium luteifluviistationis]